MAVLILYLLLGHMWESSVFLGGRQVGAPIWISTSDPIPVRGTSGLPGCFSVTDEWSMGKISHTDERDSRESDG